MATSQGPHPVEVKPMGVTLDGVSVPESVIEIMTKDQHCAVFVKTYRSVWQLIGELDATIPDPVGRGKTTVKFPVTSGYHKKARTEVELTFKDVDEAKRFVALTKNP